MLPAHLRSNKRREDYPPSSNRHSMASSPSSASPALGVTGVVCQSETLSRGQRGSLHYTIYRPRNLQYRPPLVCVAGGPGLPCQYLSPLVHLVEDRAIVLYDHVGCGQSLSSAGSKEAFDLQKMVEDLTALIDVLDCEQFHLLGHSFGGFLVYEYCRLQPRESATGVKKECLSVTLASTPISVRLVQENCKKLQEDIQNELDGDIVAVGEVFSQRHECRVQPLPLHLHQSFESAGVSSTSKGFQLLNEYDASASESVEEIPALVLRGQYDFVSQTSCCKWMEVFPADKSEFVTLAGCAHYGMLENESLFGSVLSSFVRSHEPPPKPLVFTKRPR